jgi:hypothetical protein
MAAMIAIIAITPLLVVTGAPSVVPATEHHYITESCRNVDYL